MSLFIWRVLAVAMTVLFVTLIVVLLATNLTKNKYYKEYHNDELLKSERSVNSVNSIYLTSGETKKFIRKYVVCKTVYEKYLVCNFNEKYKYIKYFVVQFSKRKKVISVLEVVEREVNSDSSKIIALKRNCAHVNIVVGTVDGTTINLNYIRPISRYRIRLYSFLRSAALFAGLFVLRHGIVEVFGGAKYVYQYLNDPINFVAVIATFVLAVIGYFVSVSGFRMRNAKVRNGGALEYEFV